MQDFIGKKILLGVCGGIAAYKAAYLVRELTQLGASVRVVLTASAQRFVTPLTFQGLSGHPVRADLFDETAERAMSHIELARWADYLLIAPASANCIAKLAHGLADDLLSTLYLVTENPVFICPAMNHSMWDHPATQANCQILKDRGVIIIGPEEGEQACGEYGFGRLSEQTAILNALRLHPLTQCLKGHTVMVTAGPTQEAIDPVRYLSNKSSGKMGYALAAAAARAGATVTLISGPTVLSAPANFHCQRVTTAAEMYESVMAQLTPGVIFIGAAAVSDYRVASVAAEKIKKRNHRQLNLELIANPDILKAVAESKQARYVVGFAAETEQVLAYAQEKLIQKKLDMVIANQVGENKGFEKEENQVTLLTHQQRIPLAFNHKVRLAGEIIAIIAENLQNVCHLEPCE